MGVRRDGSVQATSTEQTERARAFVKGSVENPVCVSPGLRLGRSHHEEQRRHIRYKWQIVMNRYLLINALQFLLVDTSIYI
jgi:hypothetical protein